jgi:hypothetical protein
VQKNKDMDFTGIEYLIYSNKSNRVVLEKFNKKVEAEGYQFLMDQGTDEEKEYYDFFYYKDHEMYEKHQKIGYNIELNGEGCFWLYSGMEMLDKSFIVPETINVNENFFQYVWFVGKEYYYMLTLPEDIYKNEFSRKIFTLLCDTLKQ